MIVNGKEMNVEEITPEQLIQKLGLNCDNVVVEVDRKILSKDELTTVVLDGRERVEIIGFIGGG